MKRIGMPRFGSQRFGSSSAISRWAGFALAAAVCYAPGWQLAPAGAAEEYENFLNGLRQRSYYDIALDYLDSMRNSPLLSEEQKQMIPFEEARTSLEASRSERDPVNRDKMLDIARDKFKDFVAKNPSHPQAPGAETQLGAVLVERGRSKVEQALRPEFEKNKKQLLEEARKFFEESEAVFLQAEAKFKTLLDSFPKFMAPNDPRVAQRERAKGDLIQAHMFHAYGLYEKSRTFDNGSNEWKTALTTAAEKYGAIYKDYRTLIAGLTARLKEGQCYQELGDTKRALGLYNDLLGQPDELKALRPYKASAMYLSLECWISDTEKLYELATIQGAEFINASSNDELVRPEWQAVRYFTAAANEKFAASFKPDVKGEELNRKQRALDAAAENAEAVAGVMGEYQDRSRALLQRMGSQVDKSREPRTFLEAQNRGTDEMGKFSAAMAEAQKATDAAAQQAKLKEADEARAKAIELFYKALSLAEDNTSLEDKNIVRYYIGYMTYTMGRTYDAAVVGEFLLRYYPNSGGARSAAKIALACYVQEYQNNQAAKQADPNAKVVNAEYDRNKMYAIASEITKRWAGEAEADEAWNILLAIAINEKNVADILKTLGNIQETAAMRSDAEMRAGSTLWSLYNEQLTLEDGDPGKPPAEKLQELAKTANGILAKAVERDRPKLDSPAKLTLSHADAIRFLADSYIAMGQADKALPLLEDPKLGLLALVRNAATNPAATVDPIPLETYKLALQAYILNNKVAEAQKLIPELDALMAKKGGNTKEELSGTYLNLALRLEKQVDTNRQAGNIAGIKAALSGFRFFLEQVRNAYLVPPAEYSNLPPEKKTMAFQNVNWVSDNMFKLAVDLLNQPQVPPDDRKIADELLAASSAIDDQLAPLTEPNSDAQLIVKLRKARAMRRAGKFVESVNALQEVLNGRRNLMEAQVEAADTLAARALANAPKDPKELLMFDRAIGGSRPDPMGDNIIWGWKRIADTMRRVPQFVEPVKPESADPAAQQKYADDMIQHKEFMKLFHTGRYNAALNYYQWGMLSPDAAERSKQMKAAIYTIDITSGITPDMGGPEWKPKYDALKAKAEKAK